MILPVLIFFILFHYKPMYGAIIAFKDYTPALGIDESPWVGLENFFRFFDSVYFGRLIRNTILLSVYSLIFGFPAPIILALLLNEVKNKKFKGLTQTVTYLPHFISMIVVTGMLVDFSMTSGLFNDIIEVVWGGAFTSASESRSVQNYLCGIRCMAGSGMGIHYLSVCIIWSGQSAIRSGSD